MRSVSLPQSAVVGCAAGCLLFISEASVDAHEVVLAAVTRDLASPEAAAACAASGYLMRCGAYVRTAREVDRPPSQAQVLAILAGAAACVCADASPSSVDLCREALLACLPPRAPLDFKHLDALVLHTLAPLPRPPLWVPSPPGAHLLAAVPPSLPPLLTAAAAASLTNPDVRALEGAGLASVAVALCGGGPTPLDAFLDQATSR